MSERRKINGALVSVYHKDKLEGIISRLNKLGVKIYSTGGTYDFIKGLGVEAKTVESLTGFPSIFGGRVKTLHPKVFGGILYRRGLEMDEKQQEEYEIPAIDLVIVDLYPFEETLKSGAGHDDIIEKIDIGGISLIRAAAKNYKDVIIIPSSTQYDELIQLLDDKKGYSDIEDRRRFAAHAFAASSYYDTTIFKYFNIGEQLPAFRQCFDKSLTLRYGENPHQNGIFWGSLDEVFEQLHGKEISYNNLVDIEAAINLISDFKETAFAVIKHTNACGAAVRSDLISAWKDALAGDPISAFGGVLVTNTEIDEETAFEINKIFFEVIIAPSYKINTLEILKQKKNRVILQQKQSDFSATQFKSLLNGIIEQDKDLKTENKGELKQVTERVPTADQINDLLFANILVKHTKSNAIILAKNRQLIGSGIGQTSRVDSLKQAIKKAQEFGFDLHGAVMASDAFFPFADCVEIAHDAGIAAVIQPGGSVRDQETVDYCNKNGLPMVITGFRHFKH
jgi:phosphoribosylaminoimidazolecarboxamide formyltransferase / IMP cyclohydrolase